MAEEKSDNAIATCTESTEISPEERTKLEEYAKPFTSQN